MATEEIDDLTSHAPPAKRIRLEMESATPPFSGIPGLGRLNLASPNLRPSSSDSEKLPASRDTESQALVPTLDNVPPILNDSQNRPPTQPETNPEGPTVNLPKISNDSSSQPPPQPESNTESPPDNPSKMSNDSDIQPSTLSECNSESPPVTHALEALLGGLDSGKAQESEEPPAAQEEQPAADEHPEWEVDSSPIESSSEDSSSDDSSSEEDSDDEDNAYKLLSPEEQARILMEGDGGSDDEGGATKAKGSGGQLRTKNEIPEEVIPKPDVKVTPEMRIEELGVVETIVENIILIKAKTSGEYRALESGSVICLADRSVIGVVSETLGRVQQPLYTVRFTNAGEITEAGISTGTKAFYPEQYAKYALTQVLKAYKGSDASNLHDEEVGDEEMEFSDDEAEAEHKRRLKQKKLEKRGGKMQQNGGSGRGGYGHPLQQQHSPPDGAGAGGLSYEDDGEDDGPYKPLVRPTGFANTVGWSEAPQEGAYVSGMSNRGGRGDFRGRGRGDRGRGRGERGRGRGGYQDRRESNGYSVPSGGRPNSGYGAPHQIPASQANPPFNSQQGAGFPQYPAVPPSPSNFQFNPQQPPAWPQFSQQQFQQFQQAFPGLPNMPNGWNVVQPPPSSSGAFINPAFFASGQPGAQNQWNQQQGQQGGKGRGSS